MPRQRVRPTVKPRTIRRVKMLVLGNCGVGKSALRRLWCGTPPEPPSGGSSFEHTVAVDFAAADVPPLMQSGPFGDVKLNFWDVSSHPEFRDVRVELYRPQNKDEPLGAFLVFDVRSRASLLALDTWAYEARTYGASGIPCVVVANRSETPSSQRQVSATEAKDYCAKRGFALYETHSVVSVAGTEQSKTEQTRLCAPLLYMLETLLNLGSNTQQQGSSPPFTTAHNTNAQNTQSNNSSSSSTSSSANGVSASSSSKTSSKSRVLSEDDIAKLSVKELKASLVGIGMSHADCLTKADLRRKLGLGMKEVARQEAKQQQVQQEAKQEQIHKRVVQDVRMWARNKDIRQMLNSIHGHDKGVNANAKVAKLSLKAGLSAVSKAYKRALLRIHPDKHSGTDDYETHVRATETFKAVNAAYLRFKEQQS